MKLVNYLISLFLFTFALALPVDLKQDVVTTEAKRDFAVQLVERLSDIVNENAASLDLEKRDNAALTAFMTQLNTTGTGVGMVEFFATNPLTQSITINGIIGFLKGRSLTDLLNALDESNLAVDIVNEVISHPEAFSGLVTIGKELYADGYLKKRDLEKVVKRGLFSSILDGVGSVVGSIVDGVQSGVNTVGDALTSNTTNILDPGSVLNTTTNVIGSIGDDIANTTTNVIGSVTSTAGEVVGGVVSGVADASGALSALNIPGLDGTEVAVFSQLLSLIGNNDVELVMESLDKSGLGSSVIYAALTDSDMQSFVVKLVAAIESNHLYTLSDLWDALMLTSFLIDTVVELISTTQYRDSLVNFVLYLLTHIFDFI
jgi:hypothetical protein